MPRGLLTVIFICIALPAFGQVFHHEIESGKLPWSHEEIDTSPQDFSFVIHADLTGGERPGVFETAARQIALLRPDFVISVGDLIEGGGDRAALTSEWESFDARARLTGRPYFYVGGNHDLSSEDERAVWKERHGPPYYHFRFHNVLFLVLDTEDMSSERRAIIADQRQQAVEIYKNEGIKAFAATPYARSTERVTGAISKAQAEYFIRVIEKNTDVRHTFIFVHKPAWDAESSEFHKIESAFGMRPYTVFSGHVHGYEFRRRFGREYIQLATTGGESFSDQKLSVDHLTLVNVTAEDVEIATITLDGIRNRKGQIPKPGLGGMNRQEE